MAAEVGENVAGESSLPDSCYKIKNPCGVRKNLGTVSPARRLGGIAGHLFLSVLHHSRRPPLLLLPGVRKRANPSFRKTAEAEFGLRLQGRGLPAQEDDR